MSKREPDCSMTVELEGKSVEVEIYIDPEYKALRYEITSKDEIEPLESAFILMAIARCVCEEANMDPEALFESYSKIDEEKAIH